MMDEQVTVSQTYIDDLMARIEALEAKLADKESEEDHSEDDDEKTLADSLGDAIDKMSKESGRILKGIVEATSEALNETADALSSLSDETDKDKLGEVPAAFVSIFRRAVDIQKKALDKFEESCAKSREDDED